MMTFEKSGYIENCKAPALFTLLFGPLYFIFKGTVRHAIIALILGLLTNGITILIYPFFAKKILRGHYGRKGYTEVTK